MNYYSKDFEFNKIKELLNSDELSIDLRKEYSDEILLIDTKSTFNDGNMCGFSVNEKYVNDVELLKIKNFLVKVKNNTSKLCLIDDYEKYINIIDELLNNDNKN
jgi:hypothetical protein